MKVSESWLREWVSPNVKTEQLVHLLTMAGLEVDGVEPAAPAFTGVVVGEITAIEAHPDAEKLRVCTVSNGATESQVVCGAKNAALGLKIPFAQVGAELPGGLTIKQAALRGVESAGMLCGASEIGLEDAVDGLLELPNDAVVGQDIREYLNLDDAIIEVDLTPNRGDCLSMNGVARETGVLTVTDVLTPASDAVTASIEDALSVTLSAGEYCPRYAGRVIRNIDLSVSTPLWMREKLRRADVRSIDPVVDVTNYVMIELGQPLHAFDLERISGGIDVRLAQQDECLTLLDEKEVKLNADMLVIADSEKALALAGIMGGNDSAVTTKTQHVFLESAFFVPEIHAGKARNLGMHTDASHRYERGVDSNLQVRAIERATKLLLDIVGGQAGPVTLVEAEQHLKAQQTVVLRESQIKRVLGFAIPAERVLDILARLDLSPVATDGGWTVTVPSHRFDIEIEADLLEELARIYGYDQLPVVPPVAKLVFSERSESVLTSQDFCRNLIAKGYREAITYSFVDPELQQMFQPNEAPVELLNPIASDMAVMRTSILPGLVSAARYNLNRQQTRLQLFETGQGFTVNGQKLDHTPLIAGLLVGQRSAESWLSGRDTNVQKSQSTDVFDFYDIKSHVESLLALRGQAGVKSDVRFVANTDASPVTALHPGQSAKVYLSDVLVGYVGLLHPELLKKLDVEQEIWVFELQLNLISVKKVPKFKELSKFPEVRRDLAIIVDGSVAAGEVVACAREAATEHLVSLIVFDQYSGAGIEEGKQSIGLGITWQNDKRTLNEDEVNTLTDDVVTSLKQRFNASLR